METKTGNCPYCGQEHSWSPDLNRPIFCGCDRDFKIDSDGVPIWEALDPAEA